MTWLYMHWGCGGLAPTHFQPGTQRRQEVKPPSSHFTPQKTHYPYHRRLGVPQSWSEHHGKSNHHLD